MNIKETSFFILFIISCSNNEVEKISFSIDDKGISKIFYIYSNNRYKIFVNNSIWESGTSKINNDSVYLFSNHKFNYTAQNTYYFILKKDSICQLDIKYNVNDKTSNILGVISNYKLERLGCYLCTRSAKSD